jgi:hemolysin III
VRAPRWLYTLLYIGLGWVAAFFIPQFLDGAGITVCVLVALGGVLYSVGGLVYGLRRPDPAPAWFGFHEVFHAFTVAAYVAQYIAVSFVVYRAV